MGYLILFGMGTNSKGCFSGGMGGKILVVFQGRWDFKKNSKELFFWCCGMGCLDKVNGFLFFGLFFFCDMVMQ